MATQGPCQGLGGAEKMAMKGDANWVCGGGKWAVPCRLGPTSGCGSWRRGEKLPPSMGCVTGKPCPSVGVLPAEMDRHTYRRASIQVPQGELDERGKGRWALAVNDMFFGLSFLWFFCPSSSKCSVMLSLG